MEVCVRCKTNGNQIRLFDAIYDGKMSSICERCAIIENIPIIRKPGVSQIKESQKNIGVYERMKRLSGYKDVRKSETFLPKDRLAELEKHPELMKPEKNNLNLVEFYHWEIMKNRRRKGLSQKQLAQTIKEPEASVVMIEKGMVPENAERLISKLEQFFQIRLKKLTEVEKVMLNKTKKPILLDEDGRVLDRIPEPKIDEDIDEEAFSLSITPEIEREVLGMKNKSDDFSLRRADVDRLTINDLREIHRRRIDATKQEKIEEQKKIESGQRLIEARKEELRLTKERESRELDEKLGGAELLDENSKRKLGLLRDSREVKEFDEELI